jgi:aminopeptidase N
MQKYLQSGDEDKNLVRYYYKDKEDMFDAVSYEKGGRILNMLRNYVGDSAFFRSLNKYLTDYKFKTAEADQLRMEFEAVTGTRPALVLESMVLWKWASCSKHQLYLR